MRCVALFTRRLTPIIAADRDKMLDSTLYMACEDPKTGEITGGVCSCMMCKRMAINAGIREVIVRETKDTFTVLFGCRLDPERRQPFRKIRILIKLKTSQKREVLTCFYVSCSSPAAVAATLSGFSSISLSFSK